MIELGGTDDAVARQSAEHLIRLRWALTAMIERAVARGKIPPGRVSSRVDLIIGLLLGIVVAVRAGMPATEIGALIEAARAQIDEWSKLAARPQR